MKENTSKGQRKFNMLCMHVRMFSVLLLDAPPQICFL